MKVLLLVVMPLVTGGALHNVLRSLGVSVPAGLAGMMGGGGSRSGGMSSSGGGGGVGIEQIVGIAKMFM